MPKQKNCFPVEIGSVYRTGTRYSFLANVCLNFIIKIGARLQRTGESCIKLYNIYLSLLLLSIYIYGYLTFHIPRLPITQILSRPSFGGIRDICNILIVTDGKLKAS